MIDLVREAERLQNFCERQGWQFCFIGGLALQTWGEPRVTEDVDVTLLTGFGEEEKYIDALLSEYDGRLSNASQFALQRRILLLKSRASGIELDVSLGAFPFEESAVRRANYQKYLEDVSLKVCTAEDLIVFKSFADRSRDWVDVETIIIRRKKLDWNYIFDQLAPLVELKLAPEILTKLENLRRQIR